MPLQWPGLITPSGGNLDEDRRTQIRSSLESFWTHVESGLAAVGLRPDVSLLSRPWNLVVVWDPNAVWCAFAPLAGAVAEIFWMEHPYVLTADDVRANNARQRSWSPLEVVRLPHPGSAAEGAEIRAAAQAYVAATERGARLARLGDITGVEHLEPYLRQFLDDHPDPARNVFVMMRFYPSEQLKQVHAAIVKVLEARNMKALRADDRECTDDLWDNIEVYLTGCQYGIAIYEDIDQRDFNPNVAIELGYMLGHHKRCLILKEKRLPRIPSDLVGKLYKQWDAFNIEATVTEAVSRWVDVDLGLNPI